VKEMFRLYFDCFKYDQLRTMDGIVLQLLIPVGAKFSDSQYMYSVYHDSNHTYWHGLYDSIDDYYEGEDV